jgi:hypothetical protein
LLPGVLTAVANRCAAASWLACSQTWMVSRAVPATAPVARVWLVNGAALPGSRR